MAPLLAIGGPTASGKTDLALALAERLGGEIVNADSRQIYIGMDIGTAKPTAAQQTQAPHHLLDLVLPSDPFSLALYIVAAHRAIEEVHGRGRLPILVGGTGLYMRAVIQGYQIPEVSPDPELRAQLEREAHEGGPEVLLARLRAVDPEGAAKIDGRNVRRLIRALEVTIATGVPFSAQQRSRRPYASALLVLTGARETLYARADRRLDIMVESGFVEEVAGLLRAGYGLELPAMSALGYREIGRYLLGETDRAAAVAATRASTRHFIRRQLTWFRAEREAAVLNIEDPDLIGHAESLAAPSLAEGRR